jgi:hypothetical protein
MPDLQFPPPGRFWIFLTDLREPEENSLRLTVAEAITGAPTVKLAEIASLVAPIEITSSSRRFELVWTRYVAYSVRNESFAQPDKERPSFVSVFVERESSAYLKFLEETTFATAVKPMRHWEINCLNHVIDVVSFDGPIVRELKNSDEGNILAKPN